MNFDISKVYTAVNADELKEGSTVVVANDLSSLKTKVQSGSYSVTLLKIWGTSSTNRFEVTTMTDGLDNRYCLCYLISPPECKKLKWTDLKIGDVVRDSMITSMTYMVTALDSDDKTTKNHIAINGNWVTDDDLADHFEKID